MTVFFVSAFLLWHDLWHFFSLSDPPAQGAAVHTGADFNRETVAAILSELKVVREELEQVMDYVVRSALATPSSLDGANQSSCPEGHGVSKDRTAHEPHGPSGEGSHGKAEGREDGCGRRGSNARPPAGLVAAAGGRGLTKHFLGAGGGNDDREKDLGGDKVRKGPGVGCSELNGRPLGGGVPGGSGGGENNKGDDGGGGLALEVVLGMPEHPSLRVTSASQNSRDILCDDFPGRGSLLSSCGVRRTGACVDCGGRVFCARLQCQVGWASILQCGKSCVMPRWCRQASSLLVYGCVCTVSLWGTQYSPSMHKKRGLLYMLMRCMSLYADFLETRSRSVSFLPLTAMSIHGQQNRARA